MQSKKGKKLRIKKLNEQALYNHFIIEGDSKFIAKRKAKMISKKQVYVVTNKNDQCIGFMGVINNGCFHKFSYLSILAVKKRYRNKGIGEALVNKFEDIGFNKADKVFILVSDFNKTAQKFYRKLGYKKVGNIPDLFKHGVSEDLLVKYRI